MIEIFTGTVGSGKSYHALRRGISRLHSLPERLVYANFPITPGRNHHRWTYVDDEDLTVEYLILESLKRGFFGKESYSLLIIDEAGMMFNSRDWQVQGQDRKKWCKFFSQSRKFGYDVILVAQDERMIDRQIRKLAEWEVKHVMANRFTWFKWLPFRAFIYVNFWSGGKFKGQLEFDILLPWVARRYDTMKLFSMGVSEEISELLVEFGLGRAQVAEVGGTPQGGDPSATEAAPVRAKRGKIISHLAIILKRFWYYIDREPVRAKNP